MDLFLKHIYLLSLEKARYKQTLTEEIVVNANYIKYKTYNIFSENSCEIYSSESQMINIEI
jgi:hypothetical protein